VTLAPRADRQAGQSLVEFALTLPILVLLLLGAWSISKASYDAEVVQELSFEGGKMAGIDRVNAANEDSFQMQDDEVVKWINVAAHESDSTIDVGSIKFIGKRNINGGFQFNGDASQLYSGGHPDPGLFGDLQSLASAGPLADILNPNLKTAELEYDYNPGFYSGPGIPIKYSFDYTTYSLVWIPFGKASP
jgi:hypothetical protein